MSINNKEAIRIAMAKIDRMPEHIKTVHSSASVHGESVFHNPLQCNREGVMARAVQSVIMLQIKTEELEQ